MNKPVNKGETKDLSSRRYSELQKRLEEIINLFESGSIEVDDMPARFKEAKEILEELNRRLKGVATEIEKISESLSGQELGEEDYEDRYEEQYEEDYEAEDEEEDYEDYGEG